MASQDQLQEGQQEVKAVVEEVSEVKTSLPAAKEAGDGDKDRILCDRLVQLDRTEIVLRETENRLMVVHSGGQHCCMNTDCPAINRLSYLPELVCVG